MPLYFLVHDATLFEGTIRPALAASWAQRSFWPCRSLWERLRPTVASFTERFHLDAEEMLLPKAGKDLPFDRGCWRLLVGEVLLCAATNVPELETMPETLYCLLAGCCALGGLSRGDPPGELERRAVSRPPRHCRR